jgi:hypothetical protein
MAEWGMYVFEKDRAERIQNIRTQIWSFHIVTDTWSISLLLLCYDTGDPNHLPCLLSLSNCF